MATPATRSGGPAPSPYAVQRGARSPHQIVEAPGIRGYQRVAITSAPSARGAAAMVVVGGGAGLWSATRGTAAQRVAWGLGLGIAGFFGWLEGHGDFGMASAGAMTGGALAASLELLGRLTPPAG